MTLHNAKSEKTEGNFLNCRDKQEAALQRDSHFFTNSGILNNRHHAVGLTAAIGLCE